MYVITGITGNVGGIAGRALLQAGLGVRAVVRDAAKAADWKARGCEIAIADYTTPLALAEAFSGAKGVFIMLPPLFDPDPGFPEARAMIETIKKALLLARPDKVVCLSTIGADVQRPNLLAQLGLMERKFSGLPMPVTYLRAGWFIDNAAWDIAPAQITGVIPSFLQPIDKKVPMVSTLDVGRVAAELLQDDWQGARIVNLEGPERVSPEQIADVFAKLLAKPVRMQAVPRGEWEELFKAQGMRNPMPRIQMLDGFNEGWIAFRGEIRTGSVSLEEGLRRLL